MTLGGNRESSGQLLGELGTSPGGAQRGSCESFERFLGKLGAVLEELIEALRRARSGSWEDSM